MAIRTIYENILKELYLRHTHDIRDFLRLPHKKKRVIVSNLFLEEQIKKIHLLVYKEDIYSYYQYEFLANTIFKNSWNIRGRGFKQKIKNFNEWFYAIPFKTSLIYIFWGENKKCLYIGRTGNGGSRPIQHFNKFWFGRAKKVQIFVTNDKRKLNKLECLAIHYWQPIYNQKKSARQARWHVCPICDEQKQIAKLMKKAFRKR